MATITTTDAATAREKLHHIIDEIEDTRAINLYEFLKDETEEGFEFSDELKADLDQIEEDYQSGVKFYTKEEFDAQTRELLYSLRSKK